MKLIIAKGGAHNINIVLWNVELWVETRVPTQ